MLLLLNAPLDSGRAHTLSSSLGQPALACRAPRSSLRPNSLPGMALTPEDRDYRTVEYRELGRADLPSFEKVMLQGLGQLERATGLDQLSVSQVGVLRGRLVWAIFSLAKRVGLAPIRILVGVDKGQVLGTASVVFLPKAAYVLGVATDSEARGHGIATSLLERIHSDTQRKGKPWSALDVESDNDVAIRVYKRLGYEEKARYDWYVGTSQSPDEGHSKPATPVLRGRMKEAAKWVNENRDAPIREALPATDRRLSHLEVVTRMGGAPVETWSVGPSGRMEGVVRASYLPSIKSGYVVPSTWDPGIASDSMLSLIDTPIRWLRGMGASRVVVIVPDPAGPCEDILQGSGLRKAVSSTLMVRPSSV